MSLLFGLRPCRLYNCIADFDVDYVSIISQMACILAPPAPGVETSIRTEESKSVRQEYCCLGTYVPTEAELN